MVLFSMTSYDPKYPNQPISTFASIHICITVGDINLNLVGKMTIEVLARMKNQP